MKPPFSSARMLTRCWLLLGVAILLLFDEIQISRSRFSEMLRAMLSSMLNFTHLHLLVITHIITKKKSITKEPVTTIELNKVEQN